MPAQDATINYDLRNLYLPVMRVGETLSIDYIPLYFASGASITYAETLFTKVAGSGGIQVYTATGTGNGSIRAYTSGKNYENQTLIKSAGSSAQGSRLPLGELENGVVLSPGMIWTSVSLENFEWDPPLGDYSAGDLTFSATTELGTGITYAITNGKLVVTTGEAEARVTIKIIATDSGGVEIGDPALVELVCRDIEGNNAPTSTQNGSTVAPLPTTFQDPPAALTGINPSSLQDGYPDTVWTVVNRISGRLGKVVVDEGLHVNMEVLRKDEASFPTKVLDAKQGRLYGHAERLDNEGTTLNWGVRTGV